MTQELIQKMLEALMVVLMSLEVQASLVKEQIATLREAMLDINVPPVANLQVIMASAPEGARIHLASGATYIGHFVCSKRVTVDTLGVKLGPTELINTPDAAKAYTGRLAHLRSPDNQPALTIAGPVDGCNFDGIEYSITNPSETVIAVGTGLETSVSQYPTNVTLQHVLITQQAKRCIALNGVNVVVRNSYISNCWFAGTDSQAIWIRCAPGPTLIEFNYLEAASENFLTGGDRCALPNGISSDITFRGNIVTKRLSWKPDLSIPAALRIKYVTKNLFELKNARNVVIDGNDFSNNWPDGQAGRAIVFTVRNQYGDTPWMVIENVSFTNNTLRNVSAGFSITGDDDSHVSQRTNHITLRGNYVSITKMNGDGTCVEIGRGPQQLTFEDNVFINDGAHCFYTYQSGPVNQSLGSVFRGNKFLSRTWLGFDGACNDVEPTKGGCTAVPLTTLRWFYPDAIWENQVVGGSTSASKFPVGTQVIPAADFMTMFAR